MFFKKSINLTAYTHDGTAMNTCKPEYRSTTRPDWLVKLKNFVTVKDEQSQIYIKNPTAGTCPGIRDYLGLPIQIKMWADLDIKIMPDGTWTYYTRPDWQVGIAEHGKSQFGEAYNNRLSLKLLSPWYFVCDEPIKFVFTESHYSTSFFRDKNILLPPGIIDYKFQHSTNVHLSVPILDEPYTVRLRHGTPLVSMFPLTERPINFNTKQVSVEEYTNISTHMPKMFIGRYYKQPGMK
jgi:hypothetical protein